MSQPLTTLVEWKRFRFLIMDAPNDINLDVYIAELKKHGITDVVRVCEPTYDSSRVTAVGIQLHVRASASVFAAWPCWATCSCRCALAPCAGPAFCGRRVPPRRGVGHVAGLGGCSVQRQQWRWGNCGALCCRSWEVRACARSCAPRLVRALTRAARDGNRAPVLVAIALIESGLEWEQAVEHIRSKRYAAARALGS